MKITDEQKKEHVKVTVAVTAAIIELILFWVVAFNIFSLADAAVHRKINPFAFGNNTGVCETEDFKYKFTVKVDILWHFFPYAEWKVEVLGLTEAGKQKEEIVIPEKVKGSKVIKITEKKSKKVKTTWASERLKKISVPVGDNSALAENLFGGCPNLEKVVLSKSNDTNIKISTANSPNLKVYVSGKNYDEDVHKGSNFYKSIGDGYASVYFANVSFMYNYSDAPNGGYFYIDDCEYGGLVREPHTVPGRNFLSFDGWYKSASGYDGQHSPGGGEWYFDSVTLPEAEIVDGVVQYHETKIYADWRGMIL